MRWQAQLDGDPSWLLEPESPGVRYLALRDLRMAMPAAQAWRAALADGPIATVLEAMDLGPGGARPRLPPRSIGRPSGPLVLLAQLGASTQDDERIARACAYVLDHALTGSGQFSTWRASGTADCLQGNLCWALVELGCDDPRLEPAFE
jgi:hypothetical protein